MSNQPQAVQLSNTSELEQLLDSMRGKPFNNVHSKLHVATPEVMVVLNGEPSHINTDNLQQNFMALNMKSTEIQTLLMRHCKRKFIYNPIAIC